MRKKPAKPADPTTTIEAVERLIEYARKRGVLSFHAAELVGVGKDITFALDRQGAPGRNVAAPEPRSRREPRTFPED